MLHRMQLPLFPKFLALTLFALSFINVIHALHFELSVELDRELLPSSVLRKTLTKLEKDVKTQLNDILFLLEHGYTYNYRKPTIKSKLRRILEASLGPHLPEIHKTLLKHLLERAKMLEKQVVHIHSIGSPRTRDSQRDRIFLEPATIGLHITDNFFDLDLDDYLRAYIFMQELYRMFINVEDRAEVFIIENNRRPLSMRPLQAAYRSPEHGETLISSSWDLGYSTIMNDLTGAMYLYLVPDVFAVMGYCSDHDGRVPPKGLYLHKSPGERSTKGERRKRSSRTV